MQPMACTFTRAACFLFLLSLPASAIVGEPQLEILTARDVLDRVARTYAGCKSYYDSGAVIEPVIDEPIADKMLEFNAPI